MRHLSPTPFATTCRPQLVSWPPTYDQAQPDPKWQLGCNEAIIHLLDSHQKSHQPSPSVLCNESAQTGLKLARARIHNSTAADHSDQPLVSAESANQLHIVYTIKDLDSPHFLITAQSTIGLILGRLKSFQPSRTYINCMEILSNKVPQTKDTLTTNAIRIIQKLIHGYGLATYQLPHYKSQSHLAAAPPLQGDLVGDLVVIAPIHTLTPSHLTTAHHLATASNQIRHLMIEPANIITPRSLVNFVQKDCRKTKGIASTFYSYDRLKRMGAHAFCAVASAHPHSGAGILKLTYQPTTTRFNPTPSQVKSLALVGKGVTYDVGGVNVKPARYMKGMHHDMTGAAVAYSLIKLAAAAQWPFQVSAYLAISDNLISASAYKPDDVISSLSGHSIEVVHTDAEGRMMLADTLTLACSEQPDLIIDFATLTGASVAAISDHYHSIYTNRHSWHPYFLQAAELAGERVWPFPLDDELARCLDSKIADTKQCQISGGVDHIEAALFLKKFLTHDIPWIHMDLSHATTKQTMGLHLTEETGAGPSFVHALMQILPDFKLPA